MKVNTNILNGAALDWAVALIEYPEWKDQGYLEVFPYDLQFDDGTTYSPSTNWAQGGPIIEREKITLDWRPDINSARPWIATLPSGAEEVGATPLIAAMRVYTSATLGEKVDIPEELL